MSSEEDGAGDAEPELSPGSPDPPQHSGQALPNMGIESPEPAAEDGEMEAEGGDPSSSEHEPEKAGDEEEPEPNAPLPIATTSKAAVAKERELRAKYLKPNGHMRSTQLRNELENACREQLMSYTSPAKSIKELAAKLVA